MIFSNLFMEPDLCLSCATRLYLASLICGFQFSFESIRTPKYLAESTWLRGVLCILYVKFTGVNLFVIRSRLHLPGWNSIFHNFSHCWRVLRSFCRICFFGTLCKFTLRNEMAILLVSTPIYSCTMLSGSLFYYF